MNLVYEIVHFINISFCSKWFLKGFFSLLSVIFVLIKCLIEKNDLNSYLIVGHKIPSWFKNRTCFSKFYDLSSILSTLSTVITSGKYEFKSFFSINHSIKTKITENKAKKNTLRNQKEIIRIPLFSKFCSKMHWGSYAQQGGI